MIAVPRSEVPAFNPVPLRHSFGVELDSEWLGLPVHRYVPLGSVPIGEDGELGSEGPFG